MRSSTWRLEDLRNVTLNIGFVGENLHTRQIFDCKKMFDQYPQASVSMTVTPPHGEPYPGSIERDGDLVIWDVKDSDLVSEGDGEIQIVFTQTPHIARSYNARTHVCRSQMPTGDVPSGLDDFITRAGNLLEEVEDTFPAGGTTGQVLAKKSNDDYDTEWVDQGGGTEDYDELQNRPQIGGVTLTGNKNLSDLGAASASDVSAKYTKPSGGIPDTDLSSGVQASLSKADSAYQKPSGGIPAADIASGVIPSASDFVASSSFYATEMPMASNDSTKVGTEIGNLKSDVNDLDAAAVKSVNNSTPDENGNVTVTIDQEYVADAVEDWLDDHPEATTTVEDGSITKAKCNASLLAIIDTLSKSNVNAMPSSANLNKYYGADKNGVYSISGAVSSTLSNAPRSSGGAYLLVESITPGNASCAKQTMLYGVGYQYIRFKTGTAETTWTKWFNVNSVDSGLRKDLAAALASNDDLNDYYGTSGCGIYSFTSAVCATLSNSPRTSGGGYLIVEASTPHNADCVRQEMIFGAGYRYERYMLVSSGVSSWTEWVDLLTEHDATSVSIPSYWKNEIQASIDSVLTNRMAIGENIAEFIFITDTHYSQSQKKSPRLVGYLQKNLLIPDVVFGGDAMYLSGSSKLAGLKELQQFMGAFNYGNLFFTVGNHDFNNYVSSSNILTDSEMYATVMKQVERFGTTDGSLDVSHFDNEAHKVRFVQFDYNLSSDASAGSAKVLAAFSSLSSDWTVVLFTHKYWQAPEADSGDPPTVLNTAKALIQAIIAGTYSAKIAAVIVGHVHSDQDTTLDGINIISTTCDCIATNKYGGPTMTAGTDTEEAFDIVQIDTENQKLYFTRVGAGQDRTFDYD